MSEGISGTFEKTRERIVGPREVKFANGLKMVAHIKGAEPNITLQRDNNILLDLKSFAPNGTVVKFDPKGRWAADSGTASQPPVLVMGRFKEVDAILDFLHECGHLHDKASTDLAWTTKRQYAQRYFGKNATDTDKSPKRFQALHDRHIATVGAERNAWAFALKNARKLERQFGINIFKQMGSVEDVLRYVNSYVGNYERMTMTELEYLGFEVYSKKQLVELFAQISIQ